MKTVIKIVLFMVLINIFIPMVASLGFFPATIEGSDQYFELDDEGNLPSDDEAFRQAAGYNFSSLTNIGFETFSILGIGVLVGIGLMKLTNSILPLIISLFFATFLNIYLRTSAIIASFKINPYIVLAFALMMLLLFFITIIEYFTQGDASDS